MQQSLSTRRLLVRCLMIAFVVAASVAIFASPAAADQPAKSEFTSNGSADITGVCPFTVHVEFTSSNTLISFFDASGTFTRGYMHVVEQDTFSANGKTLVGIPYVYNGTALFDSSGNMTQLIARGLLAKVPLPDGSLFTSAGWLDVMAHPDLTFHLAPDKGNPGNVAGFCAALAP